MANCEPSNLRWIGSGLICWCGLWKSGYQKTCVHLKNEHSKSKANGLSSCSHFKNCHNGEYTPFSDTPEHLVGSSSHDIPIRSHYINHNESPYPHLPMAFPCEPTSSSLIKAPVPPWGERGSPKWLGTLGLWIWLRPKHGECEAWISLAHRTWKLILNLPAEPRHDESIHLPICMPSCNPTRIRPSMDSPGPYLGHGTRRCVLGRCQPTWKVWPLAVASTSPLTLRLGNGKQRVPLLSVDVTIIRIH